MSKRQQSIDFFFNKCGTSKEGTIKRPRNDEEIQEQVNPSESAVQDVCTAENVS